MSTANTILLVEDDMDTRDMLSRLLTGEGYCVKVAANGWEALLAAEDAPDLILLDLMLPGLDGAGFLKSLYNTPRFRSIPVIVITALDVHDAAERLQDYKVLQIISKRDNLFPKLKAALQRAAERPTRPNRVDLPAPDTTNRSVLDLYFQTPAWR